MMRILVECPKLPVSDALRDFVERRTYFAMGRFAPRLQQVTVRLEETRGNRGGCNKLCRVMLKTNKLADVRVEEQGETWQEAAGRALGRAGRAAGRLISRRRTIRNRPSRDVVTVE